MPIIEPMNKPGTANVGAISKAQNVKWGPFEVSETPVGCKIWKKKNEGSTLGRYWKFSSKNFKSETFEQCHSAEKCKKWWLFGIFWHPLCCKILEQTKGDPLVQSKKKQKVSYCRKKLSEKHLDTQSVFSSFRGCGLQFCFLFWRGSEL